jgi:hypothetical protein
VDVKQKWSVKISNVFVALYNLDYYYYYYCCCCCCCCGLDGNMAWENITYLLTPWCRILFKKLIVTQLVKKNPAFLWNPKVHYRVHKSPPLDHILSQPNPVRPIAPYLPKVQLNVIFPPTRRSSQ